VTGGIRAEYEATSAKLYGIVLRILGRRDLAEDRLQDINLRAWEHAGKFDPKHGITCTWLAAIARNRALDAKNRAALPMSYFSLEALAAADSPLVDGERKQTAARLRACLEQLGPERRNVILQAYCFGMTRQEIAEKTGRPVPTIKPWLRRSLAELRVAFTKAITSSTR
jgi:RNA polymerase sigma-70 factor (ECF subfamily)